MEQQLVYESFIQNVQQRHDDIFLRQIIDRQFKDFTYGDVLDQALRLVSAFRDMGLQPGEKIALISKNCAEWFIADLAMMLGSYISVPIFPTAGSDTISHVLTHSESKLLIIGKLDSNEPLETSLNQALETPLPTVSIPYPGTIEGDYNWLDLIANHPPSEERPNHQPDDLMSIVYTSGTSGLPKGAMLTHGGFAWSGNKIIEHIDLQLEERAFSYLPLAHITERVYILATAMSAGICTAFPESLDTFIDDVKMHRPTLFISVPRLWTVFQQGILEKLPQKKLNILLKIPLLNNLIRKKVIDGLGLDQARVLGCGSAPVSPALLRWYETLGMNITEAWGLTEGFAVATFNFPYRSDKVGSVGNAASGIELKIADDQEILVRSKGMFSGYYKNQQATAETIINGWLHTGDIGEIDSDGYLTITGRKKDTFKTAKGKFVAPVPIEKRLFEIANIEMMCLIGSGLPGPILLAVPHDYPDFDQARYEKKIQRVLDTINSELESHARLRGALMIAEPWSIENDILTPTLKIKRHKLEKRYQDIGQNWPEGKTVVWEKDL
ncbi:MAG: AMP-binding protein [Arenicellales bacterium]|jgi:long-subunit acyl-CoA synthetase (AMP-forming)|nr:AMP-binding protein [Arenicellales bacterium]MDP7155246.1 AMP-binding protein [Arenicellales bacterium]MDP7284227.1 AMP-binding protein [Arenicellales bacterium]MDP7481379.1 AMP-binding protein [Arenicellales bacterium]HJL66372.1 AMP-binding protein [Arenicellales bacterium]